MQRNHGLYNLFRYDGTSAFLKPISDDSIVLGIGTGPGGIDVARCCLNKGAKCVLLVSRNGRLSKVQPQSHDFSLAGEVEAFVRRLEIRASARHDGTLKLTEVLLPLEKLVHKYAPDFSWRDFYDAPADAVTELDRDIHLAKAGTTDWQRIALPLSDVVPRMWKLLSIEAQTLFRKYERNWLVYRHGMPIATAEEVLGLMKKGVLQVGSLGSRHIHAVQHGRGGFKAKVLLRPGGMQTIEAFHCVVATGPDYTCRVDSDNKLIRNLVNTDFAEPHPHGGFRLESGTLRLKGHPNVYCIGAMTKGQEYYINAVPRLVEQAKEICEDVIRRSAA